MNPQTNGNLNKEGHEDQNCFYAEEIIRKYMYSDKSSRDILWIQHIGLRFVFDKLEKIMGGIIIVLSFIQLESGLNM